MPKRSEPQHTYESEIRDDWLDRLARFNEHFGRFVRDALGVLLIAAALMSFLALGGYTRGALLTPWSDLLSLQFGWGSYLVVLAIGYVGFALLRRDSLAIGWGRLFALELAAFLTLGLLAALGGYSLLRAEAGADGGRIGWGLITLFSWRIGQLWGTLLLFVIWLLSLMTGFGIWAVLERWLLRLAEENPAVETVTLPKAEEETEIERPKREPRKKPSPALPPEYRKSLRVSDGFASQDKKPSSPRERDERLPSLSILLADQNARPDERTINQTAGMIEKTLAEFGIVTTV
ncbi:MAG: hypothetical protein L0287_25140, partial [Anaerolineae bacterium]|nr:hypothetical protein [Anaerolineae bacterium]MCI0610277.1 hypothetical protein [Anaerolineae bacterium]